MAHANTLDVDSIIERLLSVRGQPNNRTVQLAEGEIRALCASAEVRSIRIFCFRLNSSALGKKDSLTPIAPNSRVNGKRYDDSRIEINTEHGRFKRRKV